MFFESEYDTLKSLQDETSRAFRDAGYSPSLLEKRNFSTFFEELGYACKLIFQEKEILFFALLQWVVICLAYVVWIQILDWIPDSLWQEVEKSIERNDRGSFTSIELILTAWSFLVVAVASYPLSILNAAMTAAHYLRHTNQTSTLRKCFTLAFKNLGRLWIYTTIDAWITVNAIMHRLASVADRLNPRKWDEARTIADELVYYAWKIGTLGVTPALVAGKGFLRAAEDSFQLLSDEPLRAIGIRMGYSAVCWIIGIIAYIGAIFYFANFGPQAEINEVYNFYFFMIAPIFIAIGVTTVLVRPFFLIMLSKLYTDVVPLSKEVTVLPTNKFDRLAFVFATLLCVLLAMYFFSDQLGIRDWIESLAEKDIQAYRLHSGNK